MAAECMSAAVAKLEAVQEFMEQSHSNMLDKLHALRRSRGL